MLNSGHRRTTSTTHAEGEAHASLQTGYSSVVAKGLSNWVRSGQKSLPFLFTFLNWWLQYGKNVPQASGELLHRTFGFIGA